MPKVAQVDKVAAETLGELIRRVRTTELFITQAELAERVVAAAKKAGVELTLSATAVTHWEVDGVRPTITKVPFLAAALDIPVSELVGAPS